MLDISKGATGRRYGHSYSGTRELRYAFAILGNVPSIRAQYPVRASMVLF